MQRLCWQTRTAPANNAIDTEEEQWAEGTEIEVLVASEESFVANELFGIELKAYARWLGAYNRRAHTQRRTASREVNNSSREVNNSCVNINTNVPRERSPTSHAPSSTLPITRTVLTVRRMSQLLLKTVTANSTCSCTYLVQTTRQWLRLWPLAAHPIFYDLFSFLSGVRSPARFSRSRRDCDRVLHATRIPSRSIGARFERRLALSVARRRFRRRVLRGYS